MPQPTRWTTSSLILGLVWAATPLVAQAPADLGQLNWEVGPASVAWCVHFLLEPKEAAKELTGDLRPVTAATVPDLHPALKRAIADEPKYSDWTPAELCTYFVASVTVGGKSYERGDKNVPLALTYWGVAATRGEAAWDGTLFLRMLGSNSYSFVRSMQVAKLPMEKVNIDAREIRGNEEDRLYYIKFNGATIQLTGHFNPDSTGAPGTPRKVSGVIPGPIQTVWTTTLSYTPEKDGTMAGSLQVFGKRGMAKALNKSPIRLIGPALAGGSGQVLSRRESTKRK
jgi:hypothetical protein